MKDFGRAFVVASIVVGVLGGAEARAQTILNSRVRASKTLVDVGSDVEDSTTFVSIPRLELTNVRTLRGAMTIQLCADVGFGEPTLPTDFGAMDVEAYVDGSLAAPGTVLFAQNIAPQTKCATWVKSVNRGRHTVTFKWKSLGGETMSMGFRTLTVLLP